MVRAMIDPLELLSAILRAQEAFIDKADAQESFGVLINDLIRLTGSQMGLIGVVEAQEGGGRCLRISAFGGMKASVVMDASVLNSGTPDVSASPFVFSRTDTLFGQAIATGEPVLLNAPEIDAVQGSLPPGHPGIRTFLAMPILKEGEVIALAGLANRDEPYSNDDVKALLPLTVTIAHILSAQQGESERKSLVARLKLLAAVFETADEGITITDLDGMIVDVNPRFTEITGYGRNEVIGKSTRILNSGRQDKGFYAGMWVALREVGHWRGEIWNRKKNGDIYPELLSINRLNGRGDLPDHYVAVFTDISDLKRQESRLEHMAYHDALTQLPNRVLFADRLQVAISQAKRGGHSLAVCYLDLDGFKPINDSHGHQCGDLLLLEIASRLTQSLRGGDSVARIGGDEFVILLNELESRQECELILDRLLQTISEPVDLDDLSVSITASLGVTLFPEDGADADTLLRHADQSLYRAKEAGRNCYHIFDALYDYEMRAKQAGRERFEQALAAGHLVLHYQPKVNMRLGHVVGLEALARWQDPALGLIPPAHFLPFVENTPADIALGEWVIQKALRQLQAWREVGLELSISVNISAYHLAQPDFPSRLADFLRAWPELPPNSIEIEILETAALGDIGRAAALIAECKSMGVDFALDDFGTGYSSLSYFKRLPISTLKIDQSFVRDMLHDEDDLAIVEGVISLSKAFRREVIAEGVETVDHGVRLLQLGCDLAQGYGIARPMPADDVFDWHADWRPFEAWRFAAGIDVSPLAETLMIAEEDHRRWLSDLRDYLKTLPGDRCSPPTLSADHCRFGQWLGGLGQEHFNESERFRTLIEEHTRLHVLASELVMLHQQGRSLSVRSRMDELVELSSSLISGMNALLIDISMG